MPPEFSSLRMRSAKFGHGTNSNFISVPARGGKILGQLDQRVGRIPCRPAQRQFVGLCDIRDGGRCKQRRGQAECQFSISISCLPPICETSPDDGFKNPKTPPPGPKHPARQRRRAMFSNLLSDANFTKHRKRKSMLRCNMPNQNNAPDAGAIPDVFRCKSPRNAEKLCVRHGDIRAATAAKSLTKTLRGYEFSADSRADASVSTRRLRPLAEVDDRAQFPCRRS